MKIRIHTNSIRVRLSSNDIQALRRKGKIIETLRFSSSKLFQYKLMLSEKYEVTAEETSISITIRSEDMVDDHISIQWVTEEGLEVLVESDLYG